MKNKSSNIWHFKTFKIYIICQFFTVIFIALLGILIFSLHKWPYPRNSFHYFTLWSVVNLAFSIASWFLWLKRKYRILIYSFSSFVPVSITLLIYITGGSNSLFSILYVFIIIASALFLSRRSSFIMAAVCFILYGGLLDLEYFDVISPIREKPSGEIFFTLTIHLGAFWATSFLINLLLGRLERTEKRVAFLETLHKSILESIQTGVITVDNKNKILYMNPAAEEITGYKQKHIKGRLIDDFFPLNNAPFRRKEFSFVKPDGKVVFLGLTEYPLLGENKKQMLGKIFVFQDLTLLKKIEKMSILGELAAHMAHEIKTPLTSISGCLQMLQQEHISEEIRPLVDIALKEAKRLDSLIYDFLSYARPIQKREKLDLSKIVKESVDLIRPSIRGKKINVLTNINSPIWMNGNKEELKRAFLNLLVNAQEAITGEGTIEINAKAEEKIAWVEIKDTGIGISEEIQKRLFEPFFTTKSNGSGLGLAIVHKIITEHRGQIIVQSVKNKGSTFKIIFRL